jgi:hypothetical protein
VAQFAASVIEELAYDFRPYREYDGVVPEPSDSQIQEFLSGVQESIKKLAQTTPDAASPTDLYARLEGFQGDQLMDVMRDQTELVAKLCSGIPSFDQLMDVPMRVRTVFFRWILGEVMSPEVKAPAGNGRAPIR